MPRAKDGYDFQSRLLTHVSRPLNPAELAVLRAQYEKEGEMVGVQTKFNYAWVGSLPTSLSRPSSRRRPEHTRSHTHPPRRAW